MATKAHSTTVVTEQVKVALKKAAPAFAKDEENLLRLRHGQGVDPSAPLARAAGSNAALADELLFMEMALMRQFGPKAEGAKPSPTKSAAKDKMARALKAKKK
jgi:hypothetical protein